MNILQLYVLPNHESNLLCILYTWREVVNIPLTRVVTTKKIFINWKAYAFKMQLSYKWVKITDVCTHQWNSNPTTKKKCKIQIPGCIHINKDYINSHEWYKICRQYHLENNYKVNSPFMLNVCLRDVHFNLVPAMRFI